MTHPENSNQVRKIKPDMKLSTERKVDPLDSTAHPSLTSGTDFQTRDLQVSGINAKAARDDSLMRRYNR
jgi:hypothetical protein